MEVEHLRLFLCWTRPAVRQTNFTWEAFDEVALGVVKRWRDWLAQLAYAIVRPPTEVAAGGATSGTSRRAIGLTAAAREARRRLEAWLGPEDFAPDAALRELDLLVHLAEHELADQELRGLGNDTRLLVQLDVATMLAQMLWPIAPRMAQELWSALGQVGDVGSSSWGAPPCSTQLDLGRLGRRWLLGCDLPVVRGHR